MQYKTLVLQLIRSYPEIHNRLKAKRLMPPTVGREAVALKASHDAWKDLLSQAREGSDPIQISSEALELALRELEDRSSAASAKDDHEPLSLDAAMAFLGPTPTE